MRSWLLVIALAGVAHADAPLVANDGSRVLVRYVGEDGARGQPNEVLLVADRSGAIVQRIPVIDVATGDVPGGSAARDAVIAKLAAVEIPPADSNVAVTLSADGTLTVKPKGHAAVTRTDSSWRTQPSTQQKRDMQRASDRGDVGCFNPASVGAAWVDPKRRVAVVSIRFHGNDSCWEPDSDVAVLTW